MQNSAPRRLAAVSYAGSSCPTETLSPELPVLEAHERPVRADAARNRDRILQAARRLFAQRGVQHVSMEEIAAEARVGKGTLYRRFSGRASIALALLQADHVALQEDLLRGAPPLGPGAPPRERYPRRHDARRSRRPLGPRAG